MSFAVTQSPRQIGRGLVEVLRSQDPPESVYTLIGGVTATREALSALPEQVSAMPAAHDPIDGLGTVARDAGHDLVTSGEQVRSLASDLIGAAVHRPSEAFFVVLDRATVLHKRTEASVSGIRKDLHARRTGLTRRGEHVVMERRRAKALARSAAA